MHNIYKLIWISYYGVGVCWTKAEICSFCLDGPYRQLSPLLNYPSLTLIKIKCCRIPPAWSSAHCWLCRLAATQPQPRRLPSPNLWPLSTISISIPPHLRHCPIMTMNNRPWLMLCSSEASIRISVDGRQHRHRLVSVDRPKIRGILAEMMRPMATIGRR